MNKISKNLSIKNRNVFLVTDTEGRIDASILATAGLYYADTRMIKTLIWRVASEVKPLAWVVTQHHPAVLEMITKENDQALSLTTAVKNEVLQLKLQAAVPVAGITLTLTPAADDVFEVKGVLPPLERRLTIQQTAPNRLYWEYAGQDGWLRGVELESLQPFVWRDGQLHWSERTAVLELVLRPYAGTVKPTADRDTQDTWKVEQQAPKLSSNNPRVLPWLHHAAGEIAQLQGSIRNGYPCIHAGVPWFSTLFGRDSLIAAEQALEALPIIARDTLRTLTLLQAKAEDPSVDAQPGKIVHEYRSSERSHLRDVPFGCYYGTVDATPLYVSLAAKYFRSQQDDALWNEIGAGVEAAISLIKVELQHQDFLTYRANFEAEGSLALKEKGWKDGAPVIDANGQKAPHPIALCEVQGYAHRALLDGAWLMEKFEFGDAQQAFDLRQRAAKLAEDFEQHFWLPEINFYAMAIAGDGTPCAIVSSNPGHLLRTDIIQHPERMKAIADAMVDTTQLNSGWGIRTLSIADTSFDPESYQLGGVWPHDTCEIIRGLFERNFTAEGKLLLDQLLDLAEQLHYKLPELLTGYARQLGQPPIAYADSCYPQAWAATIPFSFLSTRSNVTKNQQPLSQISASLD
jgi:glycogen debranching enzyme